MRKLLKYTGQHDLIPMHPSGPWVHQSRMRLMRSMGSWTCRDCNAKIKRQASLQACMIVHARLLCMTGFQTCMGF